MTDYVTGRPPKYKNREELQKKITEYFEKGMRKKKIVIGPVTNRSVTEIPVPTITGLALFLGFESRQSFYDYEKNEKFSYTIKKSRTFIEREYEELLSTGNVTGAIFALKNMGWKDTQTIDASVSGPKKIGFDE
jgi:hypothetical protein